MALGPRNRAPHISGICCGPVNRGVAIYNGKIYAGILDGRCRARPGNRQTTVADQTTENPDTMLTSPVRIVKGKVIVGSSGAE